MSRYAHHDGYSSISQECRRPIIRVRLRRVGREQINIKIIRRIADASREIYFGVLDADG